MMTWRNPIAGGLGCSRWSRLAGIGLLTSAMLAGLASQPGCEAFNQSKQVKETSATPSLEEQQMAQLVREHAQRLEKLRQQEEALAFEHEPVQEVIWLDAGALQRGEGASSAEPATATPPVKVATPDRSPVLTTAANVPAGESTQAEQAVSESQAQLTREQLLTLLLTQTRQEPGDALGRAMNVSLILGLAGQDALEAGDLASLSDAQKQRVTQFHKLAVLLREQTQTPTGAAHYQSIMTHLDSLLAEVPLHIRKVELSRSVSSFGVFEPMGTHTFLAGRNVPMIVYVELEHFKAVKGDGERYTVKLAQELVLYNEADGLAVWREPRVQIVDESLNRRRDFFVVQRVELPARLGVGKYLLKVTMTDQQGGSIDETSIPIQIVADPSLVKKD